MKKSPESTPENAPLDAGKRRSLLEAATLTVGGLLVSAVPNVVRAATTKQDPLQRLRSSVQGLVVEKNTPYYEPWRQSMIWQYRKFERYPDIIVRANIPQQ